MYRALELFGQNQLIEKYGIHSSRCKKEQISESIRSEYVKRYGDPTSEFLKFGLHSNFLLLNELEDDLGRLYVKRHDDIVKRLSLRNMSILAHGLQPVSEKGYQEMLDLILEFASLTEKDLLIL